MNKDLLTYTYKSLTRRKTRTWLTTVSVMIGIMAIFTLISFGQGLSKYVSDISNEMGVDKLVIQPKGVDTFSTKGLTTNDLEFIQKIKGIKQAAGMAMTVVQVQPSTNIKQKYAYIMGSDTDTETKRIVSELLTVKLYQGRELKKGDKLKAVLGYGYTQPNVIFQKPLRLGQNILINDQKVEVIGFYEEVGNPQDDSNIYVTLEGIEAIADKKDEYGMIIARVETGQDASTISDYVKERLRRYRGEEKGKETFHVQTFEEMIASFGTIITVLNTILVLIALISVVISAINIMNTMYTSVLERTKDIGIMKAIGARNSDIMIIFLIESGLLGFVGGAMGVLLGYGISSLGGAIAAGAGYSLLQPYFSPVLIIGCLLFSFIVGAISGLAPAIQASKHKPVDSLRYE